MSQPEPLPGTHLAEVDCNGCGRYVLAVPHQADTARCTDCWWDLIKSRAAGPPHPSPASPPPRTG